MFEQNVQITHFSVYFDNFNPFSHFEKSNGFYSEFNFRATIAVDWSQVLDDIGTFDEVAKMKRRFHFAPVEVFEQKDPVPVENMAVFFHQFFTDSDFGCCEDLLRWPIRWTFDGLVGEHFQSEERTSFGLLNVQTFWINSDQMCSRVELESKDLRKRLKGSIEWCAGWVNSINFKEVI